MPLDCDEGASIPVSLSPKRRAKLSKDEGADRGSLRNGMIGAGNMDARLSITHQLGESPVPSISMVRSCDRIDRPVNPVVASQRLSCDCQAKAP
jgi:hypothetical protein